MNKVPESIDADRTALFCTQVEITGLRYVGACRLINIDRLPLQGHYFTHAMCQQCLFLHII